jgi:hypothetical protein
MAYAVLRAMGPINKDGEPLRLWSDYRDGRAKLLVLSRELGMTPMARIALKAAGDSAALDLAGMLAADGAQDGADPATAGTSTVYSPAFGKIAKTVTADKGVETLVAEAGFC